MADNSKDTGPKKDPNNFLPERIDFSATGLAFFLIVAVILLTIMIKK